MLKLLIIIFYLSLVCFPFHGYGQPLCSLSFSSDYSIRKTCFSAACKKHLESRGITSLGSLITARLEQLTPNHPFDNEVWVQDAVTFNMRSIANKPTLYVLIEDVNLSKKAKTFFEKKHITSLLDLYNKLEEDPQFLDNSTISKKEKRSIRRELQSRILDFP